MENKLPGLFGTIQVYGSTEPPICYLQVPSLPPPGTILACPGDPPNYYRVVYPMLLVKPITEMSLAAMTERAEAGERPDVISDKCVLFVEPFDPSGPPE